MVSQSKLNPTAKNNINQNAALLYTMVTEKDVPAQVIAKAQDDFAGRMTKLIYQDSLDCQEIFARNWTMQPGHYRLDDNGHHARLVAINAQVLEYKPW